MRTRRVVLTAVAVAAVVAATVSLVRTARGFFRLDFPVSWVERGLRVEQTPPGSSAEAAGLAAGDLVVAIDGNGVDRLGDPLFVLAAGDLHQLTVRDSADAMRGVGYRPPPAQVDTVYLVRCAVGLLALAAAVAALWTTDRREASTFLLLAVVSLVVGAVPFRTAATTRFLRVLHRMASASIPMLLVRFFAIFPGRRHSMRLWDLLTLVVVGAVAATALHPVAELWWPATASALRVVFGIALLAGIGIYALRWRTAARLARMRRQIEWVALGMFVGLVPYATLVLVPRVIGVAYEPFAWLMVLPMVALPAGFLAALTEYRLWDLEPIARDLISATVVLVTGGFIFVATNYLLLNYATGVASVRNLVAFAAGVLLVVLLQPVRQRVALSLDRWLRHGRSAPRVLLAHSARDLASVTDPRELLRRLAETLHDGLEIEHVAAYLRSTAGGFEAIVADGEGLPSELAVGVLDGEYPLAEEAPIERAGYALRVPLDRLGTVHGLLYLGLRRGIFPLGIEGREVVEAFAAQAALALENARYLDDLRRQAEEYRLLHANTQRIIESSAAAILVCDAGGRILSANSEAAGVLGEERIGLVGRALEELVELPGGWTPSLPLHAVNAEARTRSAPPRRVIMAVSILELDSGSFNGRVVVLQDVTELRELQDRMREQERLASLGRLTSGLAHEINTPLTGISSFAQMLGDMTPGDDPRSPLVAKLVDQTFRVSRIVANLHEAVRGGRGERVPVALGEVVAAAAREAARSLGALDRLLVVTPTEPVTVWGAAGAVEVATSNLVRNAFEASPAEGEVRVEVVGDDEAGEVIVEDAGPGVADELRDKVFEPFFTTKTERGGTGLGLAITRDMIAQLGGEIRLGRSRYGGALVAIRLRRWQESEPSS